MKQISLKGIVVPILTPMNPDESVNLLQLQQQVERMLSGGLHGIFCFGTNGEGYILSQQEKLQILEAAVDQVRGRVPVYAGTGCVSTADTIRLSKEAQRLGADVLSIITPGFAKASQKELYEHYSEIAKQVEIPIVLYNIPARTGNVLLPETVASLARDVDLITGAKDSSGDWNNLQSYIALTRELPKEFSVFAGNDSLILKTLQAGGAGAIAGCANVYPRVLSSIYRLYRDGQTDQAQQAQASLASFRDVFQFGNPNTIIKKAAAMLGYPVGECRRPFHLLCEEGLSALGRVLRDNAEKGMD